MIDDPAAEPADAEEVSGPPEEFKVARSSIGRNTRSLLIAQALTWILSLVLSAITPRFIGPNGFGELRFAASLWEIAGVFIVFGVGNVITLGFARGTSGEDELHSAITLNFMSYVLCACVVIGYALFAGFHGRLLALVIIGGISPLLYAYGGLGRAAFTGMESMSWISRVEVIIEVASVVIIISVLALGGRTVAMAFVGAAVGVIYFGLMVFGLKRFAHLRLRPSRRGVRSLARRAAPFLAIEASTVIYRQSDVIIIARLTNDTQVGWYTVAEAFLGSLLGIPTLALAAVFPVLVRVSADSPAEGLKLVRRGVRLLWLTAVPLGFGTVVIAEQAAPLIFGKAFTRSGPILAVMGLVMVVMIPTVLLGSYAFAIGRQSKWVGITITAFVVSIPLHLLIDPWMNRQYGNGALGAAIVFAATEGLIFVMAVIQIAPSLFDRSVTVGFIKILICGGIMTAVAWPFRSRFLVEPITVGAVVYVLAIIVLRTLNAEERSMIAQAVSRLTRGRVGGNTA